MRKAKIVSRKSQKQVKKEWNAFLRECKQHLKGKHPCQK